ncbi:YeeE/YedE family protein [Candidatus Magnetomonas plexicatena]|uniref:YeeE/YedE family protein n=1 Tax=Candidatus Magnetomonas plexicatena TaxID=2552947 RepID=UPI001C75557C|nr:YeeE/YedE family protein [Nitrospirales bacterium LBB_01]
MQEVNLAAIVVSGLFIGFMLGWVLQRGRVCMNSAFRDIIFVADTVTFRAYLTALLITIIGANFIEDYGFVKALYRQGFMPLANITGGYLFGIGMVAAGGCASGIWYKVGEGMVPSWISVTGFVAGLLTTTDGILFRIYQIITNYQLWLTNSGIKLLSTKQVEEHWAARIDIYPLTLYNLFGVNKWVVIAALSVLILIFILRGEFSSKAKPKVGYVWYVSGVLLGLIAVAAWWASDHFGGKPRGLSFSGPTIEFFRWITQGDSPTWSVFMIIGMVLGSFGSARALKEFKIKTTSSGHELVKVFLGGILMGIGAAVGGGCNIGHGLTGVSTLALSSFVTIMFIVLGNWTMVYFMFIRPMRDE